MPAPDTRDPNEIVNARTLMRAVCGAIALVAILGLLKLLIDIIGGEPVGAVRAVLMASSVYGIWLLGRYALTGRFGTPPSDADRGAAPPKA